jgi:hypothetical protein
MEPAGQARCEKQSGYWWVGLLQQLRKARAARCAADLPLQ